jgi:hypothetical protein
MSATKKCTMCLKELDLTSFNKWKNGNYLNSCIQCNIKRQLIKKQTHKICLCCNETKSYNEFIKNKKSSSHFCLKCIEDKKDINRDKRIQRYYKNKVSEDNIENDDKFCTRCKIKKNISQFNQRKNGNYMKQCIPCNKITAKKKLINRKKKEKDVKNNIDVSEQKCKTCFLYKSISEFKENKKGITLNCILCLEKKNVRKKKRINIITPTDSKVCPRCNVIKSLDKFKETKKGIQKQCEECCIFYKNLNKEKRLIKLNDETNIVEGSTKKCTRCLIIKEIINFKSDRHKHCNECILLHSEYLNKNRCEHGCLNKSACVKCQGGSTCEHKKKKTECKDCNFTGYLYQKARKRIKHALKKSKSKKSIEYLGCDIATFKEHLEKKFVDGMNWENYGKVWHIDHIIPINYKNPTLEEVIERLHYLNTQPLWASENISKGNRYIG